VDLAFTLEIFARSREKSCEKRRFFSEKSVDNHRETW